jgi:hypothetical protein
MLQIIIELQSITSIKEKRRIVNSIKTKAQQRFKVSIAEVDLIGSLAFTQIGAAYVSNSKKLGESVMQKTLAFIEDESPGRIQDVQIYSEVY